MANLLFMILGLILGSFIGVLSVSLATYSKQAKRYRKEIRRLYEWQTNIEKSKAEKDDIFGEVLQQADE